MELSVKNKLFITEIQKFGSNLTTGQNMHSNNSSWWLGKVYQKML